MKSARITCPGCPTNATLTGLLLLSVALGSTGCISTPASDDGNEQREPLVCPLDALADMQPLDVAFAFNNELSSKEPSGIDVDGDGVVGTVEWSRFTDTDDSWLGLQVAAARALVRATEDYDVRYSVVTYADLSFKMGRQRSSRAVGPRDARTLAPMSDDAAATEAGLDLALQRSSLGSADFYAGVRRANESIIDGRIHDRNSREIVLFVSNTPGPIFREGGTIVRGVISENMGAALRESNRSGIVVHSFGLSHEAPAWRGLTLGLIGKYGRGVYKAVDDPASLYCEFANALMQQREGASWSGAAPTLHASPRRTSNHSPRSRRRR